MDKEEREEKRDLRRLAKYYANEEKKMERIARNQEKLYRRMDK